jgi:hypothetical protein
MKPLPLRLLRRGVYYERIKRTPQAAIYALRYEPEGRIVGYDVFKVVIRPGRVFPPPRNAKPPEPYEEFPYDERFGSTAWSYTTEKAALEKFDALLSEVEKRKNETAAIVL